MQPQRLSDIQIKVRIVPKRVRWPEAHSSPAWLKAHACVDALENLIRNADVSCLQAEQDKDVSASAIRSRRGEICDQALRKLIDFKPFGIAEKALIEHIDALEKVSDRGPRQVAMHKNLTQALHDLREGIEATRRMVLDRCRMREGVALVRW